MSIYSRDYMRDGRGPSGKSGPSSWSVVTWLLLVNIAVYLLQNTVFYDPASRGKNVLELTPEGLLSGHVWQLLSYQFAHANTFHLLANCVGLFFLGRLLLQLVSGRHVLALYFLGGLVGGLAQALLGAALGWANPVVGASASVYAIVFAVATLIPRQAFTFLLFFFLPVRLTMKRLAIVLIVIDGTRMIFQLFASAPASPGGGHGIAVFAHLGGAAAGWLYVRFLLESLRKRGSRSRSRRPLRRRGSRTARSARAGTPASAGRGRKFGIRIVKGNESPPEPSPHSAATGREPASPPQERRNPFVDADVDAILDKISEEGMQSLSPEERRVLEQRSQKLARKLGDS